VWKLIAVAAVVLLAGCGVPHELPEQAGEVHSIAAEGALLAHEASEGSHDPFTTEHAKALRKLLDPLRGAIDDTQLGRIAADVDRSLAELEARPGDRAGAAGVKRKLERSARAAEALVE
jgi:hypothetical protein